MYQNEIRLLWSKLEARTKYIVQADEASLQACAKLC